MKIQQSIDYTIPEIHKLINSNNDYHERFEAISKKIALMSLDISNLKTGIASLENEFKQMKIREMNRN